jgi:hyperosmotically inducible protein
MKAPRALNQTLVVIGLTATLGLAACGKSNPPGQVSDTAAANAPKESSSLGAAIDDTGITAKVKARLSTDDRTKDADLKVETNNGIVTLTGAVQKAETKSAAEDLVRNVPDVKGVDNKIAAPSLADSVAGSISGAADKAGEAITDTAVTAKVKAELLADERTKGTSISVTTTDGVVALSGSAATSSEKSAAVDIAQKIDGVKKVDASELKVGK